MSRLVDSRGDFSAGLIEAATQLGIGRRQVEKDYWVTAVLRELVGAFDGQFLFKGGTSLSKAYRLVQRFSEDIDILLLSDEGDDTDDLLNAMQTVAGQVCGSTPERDSGTDGCARRVLLPYPQIPNVPRSPGMRREIVLEPGIRGGPRPRERMSIAPLMADFLDGSETYEDLMPFEIDVLHPARTMVEKMFMVDGLAHRLISDTTVKVRGTEARHFYDLYFLWDEDRCEALAWLDQEGSREAVFTDCISVSKRWFQSSSSTVPEGGFSRSVAFIDASILDRLEAGYQTMLGDVCYPNAERPTLAQIRERAINLDGRI